MTKYHIEKNTVQETLVIPLFARKICSEHYPELFSDTEADRICNMLDYDFDSQKKKMNSAVGLFGALEVAQRHYDLIWEVKDYPKSHPKAAVVNLGCGLDDTFSKVDNGTCKGINIDMPDVISIRNELLPAGEREKNISCDLNDYKWMDEVDGEDGAVFFAAGVFYYFKTEDVKKLFVEMAKRFPQGVVAFDSCNRRGAKMMTKTWLKEAGIKYVSAFFSLEEPTDIKKWSDDFADVTARSYMRGYRDIYKDVSFFHKLMLRFCDNAVNMNIVKISFK
ncbi:MAG: class I SAM-dependent methyltransferase [Lachnospiraceae bacterium]|nr:class I SAM-dependent methyltransferase [Lachnospiraceae bacterium]MBR1817148.1 class I SAM-dependent methyltransferase [Lachnospiraceae bacterium]